MKKGVAGVKVSAGARRGFMMVEAIVALTILTIGLVAMAGLIYRSLELNREVSKSYVANYLAAEGIEIVKDIIDTNYLSNAECRSYAVSVNAQGRSQKTCQPCPWDDGLQGGTFSVDYSTYHTAASKDGCGMSNLGQAYNSPLRFDAGTGLYGYGTGADSGFSRKVYITEKPVGGSAANNEIDVESWVSWTGIGGQQRTTAMFDKFFKWK